MADPAAPSQSRRIRRGPPKLLIIIIAAALLLVAWLLFRNGESSEARFTGYVVTDNLYLASPVAGRIAWIGAREGDEVASGTPLFRIDPTERAAQVDQARAQVNATSAQTAERRAALGRARANLAAAEVEADRIGTEVARLSRAQSEEPGSVAALDLDQARAAHRTALRRRDAARTEVAAADAAIRAASAEVDRSRAGVAQAQANLTELSPMAPTAARVESVMYQTGEWAAANAPVISLVPLGEVKVRFYVPQGLVSDYRPGKRVAVACDGCRDGMTAKIEFVSSRPEYTPPVIYSLEARDKLVFMVEAVPSDPRLLVPGQPIDVTPLVRGDKR